MNRPFTVQLLHLLVPLHNFNSTHRERERKRERKDLARYMRFYSDSQREREREREMLCVSDIAMLCDRQ